MNLLQLDETLEEFLAKSSGETLTIEAFDNLYYPNYKKVKGTIYLHLEEGICKVPFKDDSVIASKITLVTDDEVEIFKQIVGEYEELIEIGKYIIKNNKSDFKIIPAPITIDELKRQIIEASDDNDQ